MTKKEITQRLDAIVEMIGNKLNYNKEPILVHNEDFLRQVRAVALGLEYNPKRPKQPETDHVIISCDASIKNNPGGPAAIGIVIQNRANKPTIVSRTVPSRTVNEGEYDAVYEGLRTFVNLCNNPLCLIEVRSDSQLVINQLNGDMKCNKPRLEKRKDSILELVKSLPVPVKFVWKPRNSTPELTQANYAAQDALGVPRH